MPIFGSNFGIVKIVQSHFLCPFYKFFSPPFYLHTKNSSFNLFLFQDIYTSQTKRNCLITLNELWICDFLWPEIGKNEKKQIFLILLQNFNSRRLPVWFKHNQIINATDCILCKCFQPEAEAALPLSDSSCSSLANSSINSRCLSDRFLRNITKKGI